MLGNVTRNVQRGFGGFVGTMSTRGTLTAIIFQGFLRWDGVFIEIVDNRLKLFGSLCGYDAKTRGKGESVSDDPLT